MTKEQRHHDRTMASIALITDIAKKLEGEDLVSRLIKSYYFCLKQTHDQEWKMAFGDALYEIAETKPKAFATLKTAIQ